MIFCLIIRLMKKIFLTVTLLMNIITLPVSASDKNILIKSLTNQTKYSYCQNYFVIPDFKTENLSLFYIDGYKYKRPSAKSRTKAAKALITEIQNAKESIYFAIYGIAEQPDIEKTLINAKRRGVEVKGVVDMTQDNKNIYSGTEKFIESLGNIHNDYEIANLYTKEFEQMYDLKFHTIKEELKNNKNIQIDNDTKVSVFFAPKNKVFANELHYLLKSAQKTIYVEMFYLTNKYLVKDLIFAKQRGVDVKVILDASSANNAFSVHHKLRSAGIPVKIENWGGKMHTKAAIIDNEYYVIGSMNWTGKAELHNDENLLIIQNSALAKNATKHFNHLWNIIPDKYLIETPKAEGIDSKYSCFDGMDNDHDGKVDCNDDDCLDCCGAKIIK